MHLLKTLSMVFISNGDFKNGYAIMRNHEIALANLSFKNNHIKQKQPQKQKHVYTFNANVNTYSNYLKITLFFHSCYSFALKVHFRDLVCFFFAFFLQNFYENKKFLMGKWKIDGMGLTKSVPWIYRLAFSSMLKWL